MIKNNNKLIDWMKKGEKSFEKKGVPGYPQIMKNDTWVIQEVPQNFTIFQKNCRFLVMSVGSGEDMDDQALLTWL